MKLFTKTSIALFTIVFLFISCNQCTKGTQQAITSSRTLNNPVIQILASDTTSSKLLLSDGGRSFTYSHGVVTWINMPFSGVKSIDKIYLKDTTCKEIFKENYPRPITHTFGKQYYANDIWLGLVDHDKIKKALPLPVKYCYSIEWTDEHGKSHIFDPEIEVNEYYEE